MQNAIVDYGLKKTELFINKYKICVGAGVGTEVMSKNVKCIVYSAVDWPLWQDAQIAKVNECK